MAWPTASSDSRGNARRKAAAVTNHADPEVLAHVGLFADLTTPELIGLARLMRPRAYARDEVIYLRGDPGMAFYVIASGRVKIALTSPDGKEIILRRLGPGGFHGELALLGDRPRSADAISTEPSVLLVLQRDAFRQFLADHASAATKLLATVSQYLRRNAGEHQQMARRLREAGPDSLRQRPDHPSSPLRSATAHLLKQVGSVGFEPTASAMSTRRSNQLS